MDLLEWIQRRTTKIIKGLKHLSCEHRLRQLGFTAWRRESLGRPYRTFQHLKEACKKSGEEHFTAACNDRTRGNSFYLKEGRFMCGISKKFFPVKVMTLEHAAHRVCGCPIPGNVQSQASLSNLP